MNPVQICANRAKFKTCKWRIFIIKIYESKSSPFAVEKDFNPNVIAPVDHPPRRVPKTFKEGERAHRILAAPSSLGLEQHLERVIETRETRHLTAR
jgi:hypothetical protein